MSKHTYLAHFLEKTLLIISLKSSREAVFVPASLGWHTFVPHIVILVLFVSFSQALLHTPLMCSRFHSVCLLECFQILLQRMYLFLKFSYLFHLALFPLLGTVSPFHLRMMFSMFLGVWHVLSVVHS